MELIVEVVHPQVKLKATCKALTMGARLDFDAILQQTYFALCLWESYYARTEVANSMKSSFRELGHLKRMEIRRAPSD